MNKSELIEVLASKTEISKAVAGKALDALVETIVETVAKGDSVTLVGFGTFKSAKRAARQGRNPQTGKALKIAATTVPKFTAGAGFKDVVAGKKKLAKKVVAKKPAAKPAVAKKAAAAKKPAAPAKKPAAKPAAAKKPAAKKK